MFLDHPQPSATDASTGPARSERLDRVHGHAPAAADGVTAFVDALTRIHDHAGSPIVFRHEPPSGAEQDYRMRGRAGKVGDGTGAVEHEF